MAENKPNIAYTNEIIREMSGLKDLSFGGIPESAEMNEGERLLSRMASLHFLLVYVATGRNVEVHLQHCGYKKEKLNAAWWKHFDHIRKNAAGRYSKNARYYIAAMRFILQPGDDELMQTGDVAAAARYELVTQCALLMSALHPEADHPFFKAAIDDMPRYIREKKHPVFTESPELTPEEWEQIKEICNGVLEVYEKDTIRSSAEIVAQYVAMKYLPHEEAAAADPLPLLRSIAPTKHIIPNNKITNALSAGHIGFSENLEDFFPVRVSKESAKTPVISNIMVAYDGDKVQLSSRRPFTEYDRNVYNAVVSLYVHGDQQHVMTPAMIYRAMTGLPEASNPSPQQIGAVTKSIDKMRFIRVRIDCTEELKHRRAQLNGVPIVNGMVDTYLLNADGAQVTAGGHTIEAYRINRPPVLYEYSRATKQVLTVPSDLLAIKEADDKGVYNSLISNNESRIQIKGYLIRRIEGMKGKNGLDNNIISLLSYDKGEKHHPGLYEIAGKPEPNKKEALAIRSYVTAALNFWKAEKYIKDFEFLKKDKSITSIKITV